MASSAAQRGFSVHAAVYVAVNLFLIMIWALTGGGYPWFLYPAGGWGIGLVAHAVHTFSGPPDEEELEPGKSYRELT